MFEKAMHQTVKDLLKTGMLAYDMEIKQQWSLNNPGQVVLTLVRKYVHVPG